MSVHLFKWEWKTKRLPPTMVVLQLKSKWKTWPQAQRLRSQASSQMATPVTPVTMCSCARSSPNYSKKLTRQMVPPYPSPSSSVLPMVARNASSTLAGSSRPWLELHSRSSSFSSDPFSTRSVEIMMLVKLAAKFTRCASSCSALQSSFSSLVSSRTRCLWVLRHLSVLSWRPNTSRPFWARRAPGTTSQTTSRCPHASTKKLKPSKQESVRSMARSYTRFSCAYPDSSSDSTRDGP